MISWMDDNRLRQLVLSGELVPMVLLSRPRRASLCRDAWGLFWHVPEMTGGGLAKYVSSNSFKLKTTQNKAGTYPPSFLHIYLSKRTSFFFIPQLPSV